MAMTPLRAVIRGNIGTGEIEGLEARDWIAVQAMQGMLSNHSLCESASGLNREDKVRESLALTAYKIADTMIKHSQLSTPAG